MADWCSHVGRGLKERNMLSSQQINEYNENGFIVLEKQVPIQFIQAIRRQIESFYEQSKTLTESDDRIDLEPGHTAKNPRLRRIKLPHLNVEACAALMRHDSILEPVRNLIGPNLRLHTSKLNMKSAGFGSPVEWHQDWAFYPHTNDDILAVGVMIDDMTEENGPLMMLPGTHKNAIYNHHTNGRFTGAIDVNNVDHSSAVKITGPAGSISLHHVRLVHGSDNNRSANDRRLLLYEISAADAFPIMGALSKLPSIEEYDSRLLCGDGTLEPRMTPVPVRIPLPAPDDFGSIYELQKDAGKRAFKRIDEETGAK
jgi:ectoine hydroxylase-related dioxygenase (phytanoyl-CoA dioxygenase family)